MPYIIDAHEDLAYNFLSFGRDYRRSAYDTRKTEIDTNIPSITGQCTIGWQEYQQSQVAVVFATLFAVPKQYVEGEWEVQTYSDTEQATDIYRRQIDFYHRLCDSNPDMFFFVRNKEDLKKVLKPWDEKAALYPQRTYPVGIIPLLEGAEGIQSIGHLRELQQAGLNIVGPVWSGIRFCGGTRQPGEFTAEGYELLKVMAELDMVLDVSHMNEKSILQALERYEGAVMASHANARALIAEDLHERQLSDQAIKRLFERDGIIGVIPYNRFLKSDWKTTDDRKTVMLGKLVMHIDHMCQIAGDSKHVGIGTDFDGGFGYPDIPYELDTIADLQKLIPLLADRGYNDSDIEAILGLNWRHFLENNLPG